MPAPVAQPKTLYDKIWDDHVMYVYGLHQCVERRVDSSGHVRAVMSTRMVSRSSTLTGVYHDAMVG